MTDLAHGLVRPQAGIRTQIGVTGIGAQAIQSVSGDLHDSYPIGRAAAILPLAGILSVTSFLSIPPRLSRR